MISLFPTDSKKLKEETSIYINDKSRSNINNNDNSVSVMIKNSNNNDNLGLMNNLNNSLKRNNDIKNDNKKDSSNEILNSKSNMESINESDKDVYNNTKAPLNNFSSTENKFNTNILKNAQNNHDNESNLIDNMNKSSLKKINSNNTSNNHFSYKGLNSGKNVIKSNMGEDKKVQNNIVSNGTLIKCNSLDNIQDIRSLRRLVKICDSDSEDYASDNDSNQEFMINPDNKKKIYWDTLIGLLVTYSVLFYPYRMGFNEEESLAYLIFDLAIDIVFFIDIFLCFFSAYLDTQGNIVRIRKKIKDRYMNNSFVIDLIANFPIEYYFISIEKNSRYSLPLGVRFFRIFKSLRFFKIIYNSNVNIIKKYILDEMRISNGTSRMLLFLLVFLLSCHISSCLFFFLSKIQSGNPDNWVFKLGFTDLSISELYLISFHWTLTTITTVGYGDVVAGTTIEKLFNILVMSIGVIMYSFAIGSLSSIVANYQAETGDLNRKLQILDAIQNEYNIDKEVIEKARKVIKFDISQNQKDKINLIEMLPNKLRIELSKAMYHTNILKLYFFKDKSADFVAYVSSFFKSVRFSQEHLLYKVGDILEEMYFIIKGTVCYFIYKEESNTEIELEDIKKLNNFGEIDMCLQRRIVYNIKIKSRICEMLLLKKEDFLKLSVNHRKHVKDFLNNSVKKYLNFKKRHAGVIQFDLFDRKNNSEDLARLFSANNTKDNSLNELQPIEEEDENAIIEEEHDEEEEVEDEEENDEEGEENEEDKEPFIEEESSDESNNKSKNSANSNKISNSRSNDKRNLNQKKDSETIKTKNSSVQVVSVNQTNLTESIKDLNKENNINIISNNSINNQNVNNKLNDDYAKLNSVFDLNVNNEGNINNPFSNKTAHINKKESKASSMDNNQLSEDDNIKSEIVGNNDNHNKSKFSSTNIIQGKNSTKNIENSAVSIELAKINDKMITGKFHNQSNLVNNTNFNSNNKASNVLITSIINNNNLDNDNIKAFKETRIKANKKSSNSVEIKNKNSSESSVSNKGKIKMNFEANYNNSNNNINNSNVEFIRNYNQNLMSNKNNNISSIASSDTDGDVVKLNKTKIKSSNNAYKQANGFIFNQNDEIALKNTDYDNNSNNYNGIPDIEVKQKSYFIEIQELLDLLDCFDDESKERIKGLINKTINSQDFNEKIKVLNEIASVIEAIKSDKNGNLRESNANYYYNINKLNENKKSKNNYNNENNNNNHIDMNNYVSENWNLSNNNNNFFNFNQNHDNYGNNNRLETTYNNTSNTRIINGNNGQEENENSYNGSRVNIPNNNMNYSNNNNNNNNHNVQRTNINNLDSYYLNNIRNNSSNNNNDKQANNGLNK